MKKSLLLIDDEIDFCYFLQKNLEVIKQVAEGVKTYAKNAFCIMDLFNILNKGTNYYEPIKEYKRI